MSLVIDSGKSMASVTRVLDIVKCTLVNWVSGYSVDIEDFDRIMENHELIIRSIRYKDDTFVNDAFNKILIMYKIRWKKFGARTI